MFSSAYAQAQGAPAASGGSTDFLFQLVPLALVFLIFYFLVLRPQQAKTREHQKRVQGAKRGDVVVTSGGLIGKVTRDNDDQEVEVEIAPNVRVRVLRQMISDVRGAKMPEPAKKPEPVKKIETAKK